MEPSKVLACAQRLQAIAQTGLEYAASPYDLDRYQEVRTLSTRLLEELTDEPYEKIIRLFASDDGYQTPKVDVRAVLFQGTDQILLIQEKVDLGKWTLPGGWADVGYTPFEVAVKEAREEAGLIVRPIRLLALLDKRKYTHPLQAWYVYKAFIRREVEGGELATDTMETAGARWFRRDELPNLELSTDRVTQSQLTTLFRFAENPDLPTICD